MKTSVGANAPVPSPQFFISDNIQTAFLKLALPMMLGMLINGLYNLVDGFFVGRFIGSDAMAAVGIVFPVQMLTIALATTLSNGMSLLLSRSLGAAEREQTRLILWSANGFILLTFLICFVLLTQFSLHILSFIGMPHSLTALALDYYMPLAYGCGLLFALSYFSDMLRAFGLMNVLFLAILTGALANIVLDAMFILLLDFGVEGVAVATLLSQGIAAVVALTQINESAAAKQLGWFRVKIDLQAWMRILGLGSPVLITYMGTALVILVINHHISTLLADDQTTMLAAYSVVVRINIVIILPLIAMTNACQTLTSYYFGQKNRRYILGSLKVSMRACFIYVSLVMLVLHLFTANIMAIFIHDGSAALEGESILQVVYSLWPLVGFTLVIVAFLQGIGKAGAAIVLSTSKVYILLLPLLFLLPGVGTFNAIWMAFPIADGIMMLFALVTMLVFWQHYDRSLEQENANG